MKFKLSDKARKELDFLIEELNLPKCFDTLKDRPLTKREKELMTKSLKRTRKPKQTKDSLLVKHKIN